MPSTTSSRWGVAKHARVGKQVTNGSPSRLDQIGWSRGHWSNLHHTDLYSNSTTFWGKEMERKCWRLKLWTGSARDQVSSGLDSLVLGEAWDHGRPWENHPESQRKMKGDPLETCPVIHKGVALGPTSQGSDCAVKTTVQISSDFLICFFVYVYDHICTYIFGLRGLGGSTDKQGTHKCMHIYNFQTIKYLR